MNLNALPVECIARLRHYLCSSDRNAFFCISKRLYRIRCTIFVYVMHWNLKNTLFFQNCTHPQGRWKQNIRHLYIVSEDIQHLDWSLMPYLQTLHMGYAFEGHLKLTQLPQLKHLYFSEMFNQPLQWSNLCELHTLRLGYHYDNHVDFSAMPNLQELYLKRYNQPIDFTQLPHLKVLHLGTRYNYPLDFSHCLHLETLHVSNHYSHSLDLSHLDRLKVVYITRFFKDQHIVIKRHTKVEFVESRYMAHWSDCGVTYFYSPHDFIHYVS